ncbi:MAG: 4Fe-4S binding protein [Bacteroidetes bacterium]|nr:4Fe-4S binding protein [Bacteroidota bacterium]
MKKHRHMERWKSPDSQQLRFWMQAAFIGLCLWIGLEFSLWYFWHEGSGNIYASRPAGVEGFLPISALMSLYYLLLSGNIHPVHPAGLFILIAIVIMSVLMKKSFCSWMCPVGTLSENVGEFGKKLFGRNFRVWKWLDYPLRSLKYLMIAFLVYVVFFQMDENSLRMFLDSPYNRVADVKMFLFFKDISRTSLIVIGVLLALSLVIRNFWCRYLCPYGALLGLTGLLSPFRITRNVESCIDCAKCAKVCPNRIAVDRLHVVLSDECTTCMACVSACPVQNTLELKASRKSRLTVKPAWVAAAVAGIFLLVTGIAMLSGKWNSAIGEAEYSRRIKDIDNPIYQHNQGSAPQENMAGQGREPGGGSGTGME